MNYDVFTTLKVQNSRPLFFDAHHQRLFTQAEKLHIKRPRLTAKDTTEYLISQKLTSCALKITLSHTTGLEFAARPLPVPAPNPISLITVPDTRNELKVYKTTDRQVCVEAKKLAEKEGSQDALFVTNGNIIESTICNVFSMNDRGELITPDVESLGLAGIMRQIIMEHLPVLVQNIPATTDGPIVLVNSLRVTRADRLDGKKLRDGSRLLEKIKKVVQSAENN